MKRSFTSISAAALCAACLGGCGDDDDSDSKSEVDQITIQEELDWFSGDNDHVWVSPGPVARVKLEIDEFHHGDLLVTIHDSLGRIIFEKLYWSWDWYWYIDGEYTDIDFTDEGEPGEWTIILSYFEFTGEMKLIVETTEDVPEEPVVPPPSEDSDLLDEAFGEDGRATFEPDVAGGRRVTEDTTGRVLVCGTRIDAEGGRHLNAWRFTANGDLDTSFGESGVFTFNDAAYPASGGFDVAVDSINRILVSGWTMAPGSMRSDLLLLRLTVGGDLDAGFGTGGIATFDDGEDELGASVVIDSIGRMMVAGTSRKADNTLGHMLLLRFSAFGALDGTWNGTGVVRSSDATDRGLDVALTSEEEPLVLGIRNNNMILWRYQTNGLPDGGFGTGGVVFAPGDVGELRVGRALAIKADDQSLAVAGVRFFTNGVDPPEMVLWRFNANGAPLSSFGGSGFAAYRFPSGWAAGSGVAIDSLGRILVCGVTKSIGLEESDSSATLWRYFATGSPDTSLPGNDAGPSRFDPRPRDAGTSASSLTLLDDGKVLVSGTAFSRETNALDLMVWRLEP